MGDESNSVISSSVQSFVDRFDENNPKYKPLKELVVSERFYVEDVLGISSKNVITPSSEMVIGGRSNSYDAGYSQLVYLTVKPFKDIPVRKLSFCGNCGWVELGSEIIANIPRYDRESFPSRKIGGGFHYEYFDREFGEEEFAIMMGKLSGNRVVRRDCSVDYDKYQ